MAYTVPEVAGPPHLQIQALLAVRDADGILYRSSRTTSSLPVTTTRAGSRQWAASSCPGG